MDLKKIIDIESFNGMIVVPDIHNNVVALREAINYALEHKLFILSLGDLVDGESDTPFEVVFDITTAVEDGMAAFVIGNHDDKYYRMGKGNNIVVHEYIQDTLDKVGDKKDMFLQLYKKLIEHENSDYFASYGDWMFCHAAVHSQLWKNPEEIKKAVRARLMYGQVREERDENDLPIRYYTWMNQIPRNKMVMVGHDRRPMGKDINGKHPHINTNKNGSKVFYMDTGSGKEGHLTTAILQFYQEGLIFSRFKKF